MNRLQNGAALLVIVVLSFVHHAGCGGAQRECLSVVDTASAKRVLQGAWRVYTANDVLDGMLIFDMHRVEANTDSGHFVGAWESDNGHATTLGLMMTFGAAEIGGVRHVFGAPRVVHVTVAFSTTDIVYALQSDGVWTRWERVVSHNAPTAVDEDDPGSCHEDASEVGDCATELATPENDDHDGVIP